MSKTTPISSPNCPLSNEKLIESVTVALDVTNQQLAAELGISRATVENWRYHDTNPSADCLRAIIGLLVGRLHVLSRINDITKRAAKLQKERDKPRRRVRKTSEQTAAN